MAESSRCPGQFSGLVGDRIYQVSGTGDLAAINAADGKVLWKKKLGIEQRQSSPFYADGKLYIAMYVAAAEGKTGAVAEGGDTSGNGELFVVKPDDKGAEILSRTILTGKCYGSPIGYNGKLYIQTEKKLYCFGKKGKNPGLATAPEPEKWPAPGEKKKLQVVPYEVLLNPGDKQAFKIRTLDANGFMVDDNADQKSVKWELFILPTALVKATMKARLNTNGELVADSEEHAERGAVPSFAGRFPKVISKAAFCPACPHTRFREIRTTQDTSKPPPPGVPNTPEPLTPFACIRRCPGMPHGSALRSGIKTATRPLAGTIDNKRFSAALFF